jgi:hypothetical protein
MAQSLNNVTIEVVLLNVSSMYHKKIHLIHCESQQHYQVA